MNRSTVLWCLVLLLVTAVAAEAAILSNSDPVSGKYIVVLHDDAARGGEDPADAGPSVAEVAAGLTSLHGGTVGHVYEYALKGFSLEATEAEAQAISTEPEVDYVEQDGNVYASTTQFNPPSWGLDRIDQRFRPLDGRFTYFATGSGVKAYIIDTGVRNCDLGNRMARGFDALTFGVAPPDDCHGHGTHVAGTVGGTNYGVAKGVTIVPVRVLSCAGVGLTSQVIAGVDWVTQDHRAGQPAVANMSLGGGASSSLDTAVRNSINDGVTYAVAAGNDSTSTFCDDAQFYSPARVGQALTVAASDINDRRASFSNGGAVVDLFAPGVSIVSSDFLTCLGISFSGTSMAAPHVAGVAAQYLQLNPWASPATVHAAIVGNATGSVISGIGICPAGTPNRLLYTNY